jgi:hypothetical protein
MQQSLNTCAVIPSVLPNMDSISLPASRFISDGQADSIVGRNVLNCCLRYHVKIDEIMTLVFRHHNIDKFITLSDDSTAIADWLTELLLCRDGMLHLSGSDFDADDLLIMINFLCTY